MTATRKRRQAGEGGISEYQLADGTRRYLIKATVTMAATGERKQILRRTDANGRGFTTKKAAAEALRMLRNESEVGFIAPSKQTTADYLGEWLDGLRLTAATVASYRRTIRLHVTPHIGGVPLGDLTTTHLNKLYRTLETGGRVDGKGGLSPRTVRYVHTIVSAALKAAVDGNALRVNVAAKATPPTAKQARAEEMKIWSPADITTFFTWAQDHLDRELRTAYRVLLASGMRRGELLALRWRDVDLDAGAIAVRRSVGTVKVQGEDTRRIEGPTKTGASRVVDVDPATIDLLREHRTFRAGLAFQLATGNSLVFGNEEGDHRIPETFSRSFTDAVARCQRSQLRQDKKLGAAVEPIEAIRLHDLRHTCASLLLKAGVHLRVVSERLGHSSTAVTSEIYSHVLPGLQRAAADELGRLIYGGR